MTTTSERPSTAASYGGGPVFRPPVSRHVDHGGSRHSGDPLPVKPAEPAPPGRPLLVLSVFLVALGFPFGLGLTSALIPCIMFLPRYLRDWRSSRALTCVYLGGAAMAVNGVVLHVFDTDATNIDNAVFVTVFTLNQLLAVGFLVWVLRFVDAKFVLIAYAAGLLLNATVVYGLAFTDVKYALAFPLILVIGGFAGNSRFAPLIFFGVAAFGMANGARSFAAFAAAAPLLYFLGRIFVVRDKGVGRRTVLTLLCAGVGYALYALGTSLLLSGALGEYNRIRTETQLDSAGSLIASARPEWFATWGLMKEDWVGRGPGAVPDVGEILIARTGLKDGGFLQSGDYINIYMFGGHYNLHSIIADMWLSFGIAGLVVGAGILLYVVRNLIFTLTSPTGRLTTVFLLLASSWYLLFGPLTSNLPLVCLTVAICISTNSGLRASART